MSYEKKSYEPQSKQDAKSFKRSPQGSSKYLFFEYFPINITNTYQLNHRWQRVAQQYNPKGLEGNIEDGQVDFMRSIKDELAKLAGLKLTSGMPKG